MSNEKKELNLPTIKDLFSEKLVKAAKQDDLNSYLNQLPPTKWIKKHPLYTKEVIDSKGQKVKIPFEYLPIDKIELMLIRIFKHVRIEILNQGTSFNGVWVTVRIHYWHPVSDDMQFHDGIGACQLQYKKGSGNWDISQINHNAIAIAFPIAKTEAIKDASHHFGPLFGSNLNRADTVGFVSNINVEDEPELIQLKKLYEDLKENVPEEEQIHLERVINNKEKKSYTKMINYLNQFVNKDHG